MKTKNVKRLISIVGITAMLAASLSGCGSASSSSGSSGSSSSASASADSSSGEVSRTGTATMTNEEIIKKAAKEGKIGNWGLGNEYEIGRAHV